MMKRMIGLLVVMGLVMATAVVWAQEEQPVEVDLAPIGSDGSAVPFTINAGGPTCGQATLLTLPGGDSTDVSSAGISTTDPALSCMWGNPERIQGYRTIWYKFVAPHNGRVTINTLRSGYDTVLGVHAGTCEMALTTLACNDDTNGFSSEVSLYVSKGQTYYVEVADWHQAVNDPTLRLSALLVSVESKWELLDPMALPVSRHVAVVPGNNVYVLGGQDINVSTGAPTNELFRYNTSTDTWDELAPMPGETGYAHAAAVFYQGKIYIPSGVVNSYLVGNQLNQDVDDTHWVYTLPSTAFPEGTWATVAPANWPDGRPWTWTAAVASPNPQKQGYYLIGGLASAVPLVEGADARSEMLFYSTFSHDWHNETPMEVGGTAVPRYGHTAVWLVGKVCVTGGVDGDNNLLPQGMCYDPQPSSRTWAFIAPMNEARYGASSDVGPDGRWYVFGGYGEDGTPVATTEVYDPQLDHWSKLNVPFDLAGERTVQPQGQTTVLPRAWLQVKWANGYFWALGGESGTDSAPLPMVERLFVPPYKLMLPIVRKQGTTRTDTYDNFSEARRLRLNVSRQHNFDGLLDFIDVFYVDIPSFRQVRFRLTQIPDNSNFDIAIYGYNKLLWGRGQNLNGQDEDVTLPLPPGRYFIMVTREFPLGEPDTDVFYKVKVEG